MHTAFTYVPPKGCAGKEALSENVKLTVLDQGTRVAASWLSRAPPQAAS